MTGVSTATSLVVVSSANPQTLSLSLQAAGQTVPLTSPVSLGGGMDGPNAPVGFWRIPLANQMLLPSSEHVLTATIQGSTVELTRFTTAAGYDKQPGTPPVLNAFHLWRVRYPVADIRSGNCVFAEYHGFLTVDYTPATVPNTPPSSVVHTFQLFPKNGGTAQSFTYAGDAAFTGNEPTGTYPLPTGAWQPELDPTRSYCLTVNAFGDGDLARPALASDTLCTDVTQLSAAGAPASPTIGTGGTSGATSAGGTGGATNTGGPAGNPGSGGCSLGGGGSVLGAPFVLLGLLLVRHRRRRL